MTISTITPDFFSSRVQSLWAKTPHFLTFFALIIVSLFASIVITLAYTASPASAACTDVGGSGGADLEGGTGTVDTSSGCPNPNPKNDVTVIDTTESSYEEPFNPNSFSFSVGCLLYVGPAGGGPSGYGVNDYQRSSNCLIPRANISQTAFDIGGGDPAWKDGKTLYNGANVGSSSTVRFDSCSAQGENSAYAKDYKRTVTGYRVMIVKIIRYSNNTYKKELRPSAWRWTTNYESINCIYPVPTVGAEKVCYYNYNGTSRYSQNMGAIKNDGTLVKVRGALAGDPNAPVWNGDENTEPTCDRTGSANVKITQNLEENGYGYYRLSPTYSYQKYVRTDWVGGGITFYSKWTNPNGGNGSNTGWFTYSCSADRPFEGPFSYNGLPDRSANFDPASCPQVNWQCELEDSTTIGLDRGIIPAGTTKVTTPVTVMRNGETIPLTFSKLRVVDYTANGAGVNVTNGVAGPGVKNVSGIDYKSNVKEGSTPFYGTDVNSNSQYFKQYKTFDTKNVEKWDIWLTDANTNVNKGISFNWASDGAAAFAAERQYRVTAEFYVPRGTTIDSDGNAGSYGYRWIKDTKNCYEYDSSGNQTSNMLTATSNPTNVVRSVGEAK